MEPISWVPPPGRPNKQPPAVTAQHYSKKLPIHNNTAPTSKQEQYTVYGSIGTVNTWE